MRFILIAALAAALAPVTAQAQVMRNGTVSVSGADAAMNAAMAQGRATLPEFWRHFAAPAANEHDFIIKFDLLPEPDNAEFIWASVISRANGVVVARLANEPLDSRFRIGQQVNVPESAIVDWGYFRGNVMQGNFTTRALLDVLTPEEATAVRRAYGW